MPATVVSVLSTAPVVDHSPSTHACTIRALKLTGVLAPILDFCYPDLCRICDTPSSLVPRLCDDCFVQLKRIELISACPRCARPTAVPDAPCPHCLGAGVRPFTTIQRLAIYDEPLRQLIHRIKFRQDWPAAEFLGKRLGARADVRTALQSVDCIIPVPLHPFRQISRGFDQADVLAKAIAKQAGVKLRRPLVRLRSTYAQTSLSSQKQRQQNVRFAFGLMSDVHVREKHVVLVDDVMTTGATLRACARALMPARPRRIDAIVLAVADPRGRMFEEI